MESDSTLQLCHSISKCCSYLRTFLLHGIHNTSYKYLKQVLKQTWAKIKTIKWNNTIQSAHRKHPMQKLLITTNDWVMFTSLHQTNPDPIWWRAVLLLTCGNNEHIYHVARCMFMMCWLTVRVRLGLKRGYYMYFSHTCICYFYVLRVVLLLKFNKTYNKNKESMFLTKFAIFHLYLDI